MVALVTSPSEGVTVILLSAAAPLLEESLHAFSIMAAVTNNAGNRLFLFIKHTPTLIINA
jgi:hypothetical protein